ncbi:MAG TPA: adenosine-specific kinase [Bryobacteraceae bacterium]|nr:adenosine-specific kinase [Bryobacteraceae bacterium]
MYDDPMLNLHAVKIAVPEGANIVLGQSHFIKTVEDVYEAMVNTVPGIKFGVAFNEASGPCLIRADGTDEAMRAAALEIATSVAAGHFFAVVMRDSFPINVLRAIQNVPEVCSIFCATANSVEVIVAETEQGRGVLGVVDGSSPKGIETEDHIAERRQFLRKIGYKR